MINLVIALLVGAATTNVLFLTDLLSAGEASVPGIFAAFVAYFVLARRSMKRLEGTANKAMQAMQSMPPKLDLAIQTLESARPQAAWQFGIASQIDSQIGMIHFLNQKYDKALPYLEKSLSFGHWMSGAMLGVIHYKKKNHQQMKRVFEIVVRKGKRQSLAWNLYAYLLQQIGEADAAQKMLVKAASATKNDPKIKDSLLAVQNGKKIKMRAYKEQWYQFQLERPPTQYQLVPAGGHGKISRKMRRGR